MVYPQRRNGVVENRRLETVLRDRPSHVDFPNGGRSPASMERFIVLLTRSTHGLGPALRNTGPNDPVIVVQSSTSLSIRRNRMGEPMKPTLEQIEHMRIWLDARLLALFAARPFPPLPFSIECEMRAARPLRTLHEQIVGLLHIILLRRCALLKHLLCQFPPPTTTWESRLSAILPSITRLKVYTVTFTCFFTGCDLFLLSLKCVAPNSKGDSLFSNWTSKV
jgi:hypothetical protein